VVLQVDRAVCSVRTFVGDGRCRRIGPAGQSAADGGIHALLEGREAAALVAQPVRRSAPRTSGRSVQTHGAVIAVNLRTRTLERTQDQSETGDRGAERDSSRSYRRDDRRHDPPRCLFVRRADPRQGVRPAGVKRVTPATISWRGKMAQIVAGKSRRPPDLCDEAGPAGAARQGAGLIALRALPVLRGQSGSPP
jgi:hypothetical protein